MEAITKRTLVKSAPELWVLADDASRMETWIGGLTGAPTPAGVEVTRREPERALAWRSAGPGQAEITIELAESGFGTTVSITAEHSLADPAAAVAALEGVLDELGSPERRPFANA